MFLLHETQLYKTHMGHATAEQARVRFQVSSPVISGGRKGAAAGFL
jgi:hypothetical protein